jgi:gliding motility-associated-like protein
MITVYSHPKASFAVSTQAPTSAGTIVQFRDESTDTYGISSWSWNFYDGTDNTSNMENPSHTFSDTGVHCIHLVVTNTNGCKDSATTCVAIAPVFNIYIPNAFSPNGDHKNDIFKPVGQYMSSFEMFIFNGQGTQIYHTINKGWDGTADGSSKICSEGVYMYKIIVTDTQNKQHTKSGSVTLIK